MKVFNNSITLWKFANNKLKARQHAVAIRMKDIYVINHLHLIHRNEDN